MDFLPPESSQNASDTTYQKLFEETKHLAGLQIENARLMLTEKLTLLLGRVTLVAVAFVVGSCALIFLSMSVSDLLLRNLAPCWTYMIVAGFYVLLAAVCILFRRQLIVDPIARYISRVILDPPACPDDSAATHHHHNTSNSNSTLAKK